MDPILAFSLCVLIIPVLAGLGWLFVENSDRVRVPRPERRGFDVLQIRPRPVLRTGYSFTEVMFAVVVLGIGFVMLAAMFPVGIQQATLTSEETTAAGVVRGGLNYMTTIADRHSMRPTDGGAAMRFPPMAPFVGVYNKPVPPVTAASPPIPMTPADVGAWDAVKGNLILPTDTRFAFVPFYSRKSGSSFAQVTMIVTKCRARAAYDATDVTPDANANLQAREVKVNITNNGGGPGVDWIAFKKADAPKPDAVTAVAEGSYVIIGNDPGKSPSPAGAFNGRVYRVGLPATDASGVAVADTWTLSPGNDFIPQPGANNTFDDGLVDDWLLGDDAIAYIVGREPEVPGTGGVYRGIAQDISVYSTFVQVRP